MEFGLPEGSVFGKAAGSQGPVGGAAIMTRRSTSNKSEASWTKPEVTEALLIAALERAGTQLSWRKEVFMKYLSD